MVEENMMTVARKYAAVWEIIDAQIEPVLLLTSDDEWIFEYCPENQHRRLPHNLTHTGKYLEATG